MGKKIDKVVKSWLSEMSFIYCLMLMVALPLGMRMQWPTKWSYFLGHFSDFTSIFLYLTDFLLILMIVFWFLDIAKKFWETGDWDDWTLGVWQGLAVLLFGFLAFWGWYSCVWSLDKTLGIYKAIRLSEVFLLFSYLVLVVGKNRRWFITWIFLLAGIFLQAIWGIVQYIIQHDFGWQKLGEVVLNKDALGVAKVAVGGEKIVRSYGSLPHANAFGLYMWLGLIVLFCLLWNWSKLEKLISKKLSYWKNGGKWIWGFGLIFGVIGLAIMFSFSRTVWLVSVLVTAGFVLDWYLAKKKKKMIDVAIRKANSKVGIITVFFIAALIMLLGFMSNWSVFVSRSDVADLGQDVSLQTREYYDNLADQIIEQNYYRGTGIGNYLINVAFLDGKNMQWWQFQPVHNIFKLVWGELGVFGFIAMFLLLISMAAKVWFQNKRKYFWLSVVGGLFVLMMFDHYFWDIWQGQLAWAVVSAAIVGKMSS